MRSKRLTVRCGFLAVLMMVNACVSAAPNLGQPVPGLTSHVQADTAFNDYVLPTVKTPDFHYYMTWRGLVVTMSCATSGATIRYTTNGDTPTSSSNLYFLPLLITRPMVLKGRAFKTGMISNTVRVAYIGITPY